MIPSETAAINLPTNRWSSVTWCVFACAVLTMTTRSVEAQRMLKLAPGVLTTIPATAEEEETTTGPRSFNALVKAAPDWKPNFSPENETLAALASEITLRRPVWQLEFSFKPMRMLTIDTGAGKQRVWYLVYKVTNTGETLESKATLDQFGHPTHELARKERNIRFFPLFTIRSHEYSKTYTDRLIPGITQRIHNIEIKDPSVRLYDSVSISKINIRPNSNTIDRGVWGVATWTGIDRRTDFFSVYAQGLTNAYKWDDAKDGSPLLSYKTLQLNFWRPGDAVKEGSKEFRYGLPTLSGDSEQMRIMKLYGLKKPTDFSWVYR